MTLRGDNMKKLRITAAVFIAAVLTVLSVTVAFSATIYNVRGYSYSIINNSEIALCGWDNRTDVLSVPNEIAGRKMVEVSKYGLDGNDGFTALDFSQAVNLKTIGFGGFMNCTSISNELIIPKPVSVIGFSAFENCTSIPSVVIEADVSSIQKSTFKGCSSLETVEIKGYTQSIGYMAFANCPKLSYVEIPEYVSSISPQAFDNSPNIVIGCYSGSYALQYAEDNKIDHIILDGDKIGDVNGDGAVDILDATEIQKYAAESTDFTDEQFELGDINKDGYCDVIDALLVQKSVIGAYEIPPIVVRY
jgi:hypothetical protein